MDGWAHTQDSGGAQERLGGVWITGIIQGKGIRKDEFPPYSSTLLTLACARWTSMKGWDTICNGGQKGVYRRVCTEGCGQMFFRAWDPLDEGPSLLIVDSDVPVIHLPFPPVPPLTCPTAAATR